MGTIKISFSGEVVIVTGGSRGLGLEIAQAFGAAGATVVITARRQQWLDSAEHTLKEQSVDVHVHWKRCSNDQKGEKRTNRRSWKGLMPS